MSYRNRIAAAVAVSLAAHLAGMNTFASRPRPTPAVPPPTPEPFVMRLVPPEEPPVRRLVESGAVADNPVKPTDLISDRDSRAQDLSESSEGLQPSFDTPDEFDELRQPVPEPSPLPPPAPLAPVTPDGPPEVVRVARAVPQTRPQPIEATDEASVLVHGPRVEERKAEEEAAPAEEAASLALPEPMELAQARHPEPEFVDSGVTRGRESGGAATQGITSFEAHRHELGAYMLKVRQAVEREWKAALIIRYGGMGRTQALLECSIRPTGQLEYVRILEPGPSPSYAALCKEAIEKAAPFPPFPFEVPAIYREQNLVIRWRFSFL